MKLAVLALLAALMTPAVALADPPAQGSPAPPASAGPPADDRAAERAAVRQACAADMKSLCPDQEGKAARKCMRENQAKLSSGCQEAIAKAPRGKRGG